MLVAPFAELVDQGLGHVFDDGEPSGHVPVQCGIPHGHFALVTGGQHNPAEFVGNRHQDVAPYPGLHVLFRHVGLGVAEMGFQHAGKSCVSRLNGYRP